MKAKKGPAEFICNICNLKLSRSSHLVRHRLVHSSTSSENFPCEKCNKSYSRKDVLLRHMRTAHSATKTRRQSAKSTTPRKSVTCAHCLQPDLNCNPLTPCLPCRKHQTLCSTNMAEFINGLAITPEVKQNDGIMDRHLSTASSSSLPPDEAVNGFETEPSDVSIHSAREDHDQPKIEADDSLIDPRLRGEGGLHPPPISGELRAESPYDPQIHHDDFHGEHGVPPPYSFSDPSWAQSNGYSGYGPYQGYAADEPPAGSVIYGDHPSFGPEHRHVWS